jgi:hypothetical protein
MIISLYVRCCGDSDIFGGRGLCPPFKQFHPGLAYYGTLLGPLRIKDDRLKTNARHFWVLNAARSASDFFCYTRFYRRHFVFLLLSSKLSSSTTTTIASVCHNNSTEKCIAVNLVLEVASCRIRCRFREQAVFMQLEY